MLSRFPKFLSSSFSSSSKITSTIRNLALQPQTKLSLHHLQQFELHRSPKTLVANGNFLRHELARRLSRRVIELDELKFGLAYHQNIIQTKNLYLQSANSVLHHQELTKPQHIDKFSRLIQQIKDNHQNVVPTMSEAVVEVSPRLQPCEKQELDQILDGFYGSRIGIRTIIGQYVAISNPNLKSNSTESNTGIVRIIKPYKIYEDARDEVQYITEMCYDQQPTFEFYGDQDYELTYIPSFLKYIYLEIFKNSARATLNNNSTKPIKVYQSHGINDLIIKVSDEGHGFAREDLSKVYSYSYTTVPSISDSDSNSDTPYYRSPKPQMAGLGYGVPLSRLYARYFGGDLQIIPFYGIGTDVIIYINHILDSAEKEY